MGYKKKYWNKKKEATLKKCGDTHLLRKVRLSAFIHINLKTKGLQYLCTGHAVPFMFYTFCMIWMGLKFSKKSISFDFWDSAFFFTTTDTLENFLQKTALWDFVLSYDPLIRYKGWLYWEFGIHWQIIRIIIVIIFFGFLNYSM